MEGWIKSIEHQKYDTKAMRSLLYRFAMRNCEIIDMEIGFNTRNIAGAENPEPEDLRAHALKMLLLSARELYDAGFEPDATQIGRWIASQISSIFQEYKPMQTENVSAGVSMQIQVEIPEAEWDSCCEHGALEVQSMFAKVIYIDASAIVVLENGRRSRFVEVADGRYFYSINGDKDILQAKFGGIEIWGLPTGCFSIVQDEL